MRRGHSVSVRVCSLLRDVLLNDCIIYLNERLINFDNQCGQLDGIKQIPMRGCVEYLNSELPDQYMYSSSPIFSGDVFITRYTEKVIMPIFSQYLLGQPDNITYDYSSYVNIPYPRYLVVKCDLLI
mgnify:CR=1 FL=1